jgi:hypothetical protein
MKRSLAQEQEDKTQISEKEKKLTRSTEIEYIADNLTNISAKLFGLRWVRG